MNIDNIFSKIHMKVQGIRIGKIFQERKTGAQSLQHVIVKAVLLPLIIFAPLSKISQLSLSGAISGTSYFIS